jgi:large subunit ribosomal protein L22e
LKKQELRDFLRVIASNKQTYELRYFNMQDQEEEQQE